MEDMKLRRWEKCSHEQCNLVGWHKITYVELGIIRYLCNKHLEENKEFLENWVVESDYAD